MEIGYGEDMRFHLFQAMRFHLPQSYAILPVSIHAILMEIELRVKELIRFYDFSMARQHAQGCIFSQPYFTPKNKPSDFILRRVNQWDFIGDWEVMEYHSELQPLRDATEKTNKKITSDTYSDDDDFVNPPQKLVTKLFYIHVTNVENAKSKSSRGGLIHWTSAMLKERELEELSTGGNYARNQLQFQRISQHNDSYRYMVDARYKEVSRLMRGIKKFPDSEELLMLVTKRNHEFNLACPYFPNSDVSHNGTFFNGVATPVHGREITTDSKDVEFHEAAIEDDAHNDVVFSTPFTQVFNEEAFDIMERAALAACSNNSKQQTGNDVPVTVVAQRRTKRHVQPTEKFRSPYFRRVVNPNKVLTSNEKRVSGWVFAGLDNEWDLVFESKFGDLGYRGIFESMIPGSRIHATVIDIWASILNHQERHINKKSPARMFLSCTLLVFFPVIDIEHYYLIVFDFKKHDCVIIDNINSEESDEVKYGNIPYDLKILFTLYVDELNHKKANRIKRAKPMSGCMEWTTKYNNIDCGVFLMRHMETYKGEDLDKWDIGFEAEYEDNDDQQNQLDEMRKKYVTKILTWDLNVVKPSIYEMLASYDRSI
ncbi:hypothetical protein L2E82_22004 [Cichorium intybus]|uniref:Uncharacterized protein n=1 Tax=Cichorium intybus TaxID=13427 RepID=A0ACB9DWB0_CICIN|nr:hypothetical protein L2E82_22004 [Cichorium intybus]